MNWKLLTGNRKPRLRRPDRMPARPQTIQIYLPGGDPEGIRVAELTTRIVQVVEVPRKLLDTFLAMPESGQVALYFLFGTADSDDTGGRQTVYIGQTGSPRERLPRHRREKTFWTRAMVVISRTNNLTQTHVGLLEWMAIARCREIRRYRDANGDSGSEPYVPAPMRADCEEVVDTASTLLTTLGSPISSRSRSGRCPRRLGLRSAKPTRRRKSFSANGVASTLAPGTRTMVSWC